MSCRYPDHCPARAGQYRDDLRFCTPSFFCIAAPATAADPPRAWLRNWDFPQLPTRCDGLTVCWRRRRNDWNCGNSVYAAARLRRLRRRARSRNRRRLAAAQPTAGPGGRAERRGGADVADVTAGWAATPSSWPGWVARCGWSSARRSSPLCFAMACAAPPAIRISARWPWLA